MATKHSLRPGQKPPAGSTVYLMRSNYGHSLTTVEHFEAADNPEWVTPAAGQGFWWGYSTEAELDAEIAQYV